MLGYPGIAGQFQVNRFLSNASPDLSLPVEGDSDFVGPPRPSVSDQIQSSLSDIVDEWSSVFTPNTSDSMDTSYLDDIYDKILSAFEVQNQAAQSSADKAMDFSAEQAQLNRDFNAVQAQLNRDYQTEMSNTAYQRAMSDMQKAGLNPKLVGQFGGSSTPSGSSASSGSSPSGTAASISPVNLSALSSVMSSYISAANNLDRDQNDFVQTVINGIFNILSRDFNLSLEANIGHGAGAGVEYNNGSSLSGLLSDHSLSGFLS